MSKYMDQHHIATYTTDELAHYINDLGFGPTMQVHESKGYENWEMSKWYKPDEHELTQAEFNAKYRNTRNPKQPEDDGLESGAI